MNESLTTEVIETLRKARAYVNDATLRAEMDDLIARLEWKLKRLEALNGE